MPLWKKAFENILRKGENASRQHFSFSKNVIFPLTVLFMVLVTFKLSSANAFHLDKAKTLSLGEE